jgi:hypothetical protein
MHTGLYSFYKGRSLPPKPDYNVSHPRSIVCLLLNPRCLGSRDSMVGSGTNTTLRSTGEHVVAVVVVVVAHHTSGIKTTRSIYNGIQETNKVPSLLPTQW